MPCPLLSQDYSTNTFVDGVDIADRGVGMDPLTCTKHVLTQELQELQELVPGKIDVCFQPGLFSSGAQGLDRRISCFHESQRILTNTNNILNLSGFHGSELDFRCSYRSGNLSLEGQVGV